MASYSADAHAAIHPHPKLGHPDLRFLNAQLSVLRPERPERPITEGERSAKRPPPPPSTHHNTDTPHARHAHHPLHLPDAKRPAHKRTRSDGVGITALARTTDHHPLFAPKRDLLPLVPAPAEGAAGRPPLPSPRSALTDLLTTTEGGGRGGGGLTASLLTPPAQSPAPHAAKADSPPPPRPPVRSRSELLMPLPDWTLVNHTDLAPAATGKPSTESPSVLTIKHVFAPSQKTPPSVSEKLSKMSWRVKQKLNSLLFPGHHQQQQQQDNKNNNNASHSNARPLSPSLPLVPMSLASDASSVRSVDTPTRTQFGFSPLYPDDSASQHGGSDDHIAPIPMDHTGSRLSEGESVIGSLPKFPGTMQHRSSLHIPLASCMPMFASSSEGSSTPTSAPIDVPYSSRHAPGMLAPIPQGMVMYDGPLSMETDRSAAPASAPHATSPLPLPLPRHRAYSSSYSTESSEKSVSWHSPSRNPGSGTSPLVHHPHHQGSAPSTRRISPAMPLQHFNTAGPGPVSTVTPAPTPTSDRRASERLVRRSSSTSSVLTKRPSIKRGSLITTANSRSHTVPSQPPSPHALHHQPPYHASASVPLLPHPAQTAAASFLAQFGNASLPPAPVYTSVSGPSSPVQHAAKPSAMPALPSPLPMLPSTMMPVSVPASPAAAFLTSMNTVPCSAPVPPPPQPSAAAAFLSSMNSPLVGGGMSPLPAPQSPRWDMSLSRTATGQSSIVSASTQGWPANAYPQTLSREDTFTHHSEFGGSMRDDLDVFSSVWESGFLVEEGDEIQGGYIVGKPLGSGATSTVHVATRTNPATGQRWRYALKVVVDRSKLPVLSSQLQGPRPIHDSSFTGSPGLVGVGVGITPRSAGVSVHNAEHPANVHAPCQHPGVHATCTDEEHLALEHEIGIWQRLHHPHIVDLCDVITTPECVFVFSELVNDGNLLHLVNEWERLVAPEAHGVRGAVSVTAGIWDLPMLLEQPPDDDEGPLARPFAFLQAAANGAFANPSIKSTSMGLPEHWCRRIARQLMDAICYMHNTAGVVHRDIKLENALVRFKYAASHVILLRDASGKLNAGSPVEVPMAVAAHWIAAGMFVPSAARTEDDGSTHWECSQQHHLGAGAPAREASSPPLLILTRQVARKILDIEVKLTDFGLSETIEEAARELDWCGGSLEYCPPEAFESVPDTLERAMRHAQRTGSSPCMLSASSSSSSSPPNLAMLSPTSLSSSSVPEPVRKYLCARDVWSWAVVVQALVTGNLPFQDDFEPRLVMKIRAFKSSGPTAQLHAIEREDWDVIYDRASAALAQASSTLATASVPLAAHSQFAGLLAPFSRSEAALARVGVDGGGEPTADDDQDEPALAVVYLPDQLARMVPDPGVLWWIPNSSQRVSPALYHVLTRVFADWTHRMRPSEVLASEWMNL